MRSTFLTARADLDATGVFDFGAVPEPIANSWQRCLGNGLDPQGKPVDADLSQEALRQARQKHERLLALVRPELELLSKQISGTNYLTAFADNKGVVLESIMDHEFRESPCSRSVRNGTVWNEELRGTNGFGLALLTGKTSVVTGKEHFLSEHSGVSCVAAPIFDSQGEIAGLLDVSSEFTARQHHTKALVSLAATNIENRLFVDAHRNEHIIQFHPRDEYLNTQSVGMVSADQDGRITGANRCASDLLNGADLLSVRVFADLFQGCFGTLMSQMKAGKIIRVVDWLNSAYFARLRRSHPGLGHQPGHRTVKLSAPAVYQMSPPAEGPIFRDSQARNSLRLGIRSARAGMPFSIIGATGTGRTTLAQAIHSEIHKDSPLIAVDCQRADSLAHTDEFSADVLLARDGDERAEMNAGTLLIENLSAIGVAAADGLARVITHLTHPNAASSWVIIATEDATATAITDMPTHVQRSFDRLGLMKVHLPNLCDRSDFSQLAERILGTISDEHKLSKSAIDALQRMERPQNLVELTTQLRILAVQCPNGILRKAHIDRHLGLPNEDGDVCDTCAGNSARAAKCKEINRVFRQCNANVALAARTLGMSRNTVYAHIPK